MVGLLQNQEIFSVSLAAPPFVCVDVVARSSIYLKISLCPAYRSICDACGKEYHWRKVCRASKFSKRYQRSSGGRQRHSKAPKEKPCAEKHLHGLETHDEIENSPGVSFSNQLYFHILSTRSRKMTSKLSRWKWSLISA